MLYGCPVNSYPRELTFRSADLSIISLFISNRYLQYLITDLASELRDQSYDSIQSSTSESAAEQPLPEGYSGSIKSRMLHKALSNMHSNGSLASVCLKLSNILLEANRNKTPPECMPVRLVSELWLLLGILESATFRSKDMQQYLSQPIGILDSAARQICGGPKHSVVSKEHFPSILVDICRYAMPVVLSELKQQCLDLTCNASIASVRKDVGTSSDGNSSGSTTTFSLQCLLPDVHALNAGTHAMLWTEGNDVDTNMSATLSYRAKDASAFDYSSSDECHAHKKRKKCWVKGADAFDTMSRHGENGSSTGPVGLHDVWLECLKLLVNLTHRSRHCLDCLVNSGVIEIIRSSLEEFSALRAARMETKRALARDQDIGSDFSSEKKSIVLDKFIFDGTLYLLTLLTNLVEVIPKENILYSEKEVDTVVDKVHASKRAALERLLRTSENCDDTISGSQQLVAPRCGGNVDTVGALLLRILSTETDHLLEDFEKTDAVMFVGSCRQEQTDKRVPTACIESATQKGDNSSLPIDEIVLATHACLLICTLRDATDYYGLYQMNENSETSVCDNSFVMKQHEYKCIQLELNALKNISTFLPRQSWWLPLRVLKAYLSLQDGTNMIIHENTLPIVSTIHMLEKNN